MLTGLIAGLTAGGVYAAFAVSLTVMARLVRVVNFALIMLGGVAVYCASVLNSHGLPYGLACLVGLVATIALSVLLGWVMARWFGEAGTDGRSAMSIAALVALLGGSYLMFGSKPREFDNLLPGTVFSVAGVNITVVTVVVLLLAVAAAAVGHVVLERTLLGLRLRALSERPITAQLVGMRTSPMAIGVWVVTGLFVALVVLLAAPTLVNDQASLALLVVPGLAAALVGSFSNLWLALAGGIGLGVLQGVLAQVNALRAYGDVIPFALILLVLVYSQRREVWDAAR